MAGKRKRKKQPNLYSRIVSLIIERGPMKLGVMARALNAPYQSLNTEALEMRRLSVLQKDAEGVWSLVPGVNPAAFGIEINTSESTDSLPSRPESFPTYQDEFIDLLRRAGVKEAVQAITDIYFSGNDIWDAQWLHHVLSDTARGFVTEDQRKLIMGYWTITKGIPYKYEDFFED